MDPTSEGSSEVRRDSPRVRIIGAAEASGELSRVEVDLTESAPASPSEQRASGEAFEAEASSPGMEAPAWLETQSAEAPLAAWVEDSHTDGGAKQPEPSGPDAKELGKASRDEGAEEPQGFAQPPGQAEGVLSPSESRADTSPESESLLHGGRATSSLGESLPRRAAKRGGKRAVERLGVGIVLGGVAIGAFLVGSAASLALVSLVVVGAEAEAYAALSKAGRRPASLIGLVGAASGVVGAYLKGPDVLPLVVALVIVASFVWYLSGVTKARASRGIGATLFGFGWVGLLGSYAGLLLDPKAFPDRHGIAYLLGTLAVTVAYDVGGYAVGSALGRHQMAPAVSPNKTWEGLAGGSIAAIAVAIEVITRIHPWTLSEAVALGVAVIVLAPLGDLAESMIKREIGLKDMGSVLRGHGGLLDRIDAVLFVLPAAYYILEVSHAH